MRVSLMIYWGEEPQWRRGWRSGTCKGACGSEGRMPLLGLLNMQLLGHEMKGEGKMVRCFKQLMH